MGWRFRKRIKILPGINLNISKSGMSFNVGVKGANVTFGPNGTYVNTGVPGTGLYRRDFVSGSGTNVNNNTLPDSTSYSQQDYVSEENPNEGNHGIWYYIKRFFSKSDSLNSESDMTENEGILKDTNEEAIVKEDVTFDLTDEDVSNVTAPTPKSNNDPEFTVVEGFKEKEALGTNLTAEEIMSTPINPREPYIRYDFPGLDLLNKYESNLDYITKEELLANKKRIIEVLCSFDIFIREITATIGPVITLYEITLAEGVRVSKLRGLEDDIDLALCSHNVMILIPVPGKGTIGIEVPNAYASIVSIESILNSRKFQETKMDLPLALGKTITNEVFMVDLAKIPHLLMAGATGQGKSVCLNAMICSLLFKKHPNDLKMVLIDPNRVEFSIYNPIANAFMAQIPDTVEEPIITDVTKTIRTLKGLCTLMDRRYDLLKMAGVRNIKEYNEKFVYYRLRTVDSNGNPLHEYMPYIVVIIDEYGGLIEANGLDFETSIVKLAQNARAVGIHLIISTKRPTNDIITGAIKANFPARIAFRLPERIDSRVILDCDGAEDLLGNGDMLFRATKSIDCVRIQGAYVDTSEIASIAMHIYSQERAGLTPQCPMDLPEPIEYYDEYGEGGAVDTGSWDPLFVQAAHAIVSSQNGSTSMIQRQFGIGYNRAGRLMEQLEKAGIVGPAHGSKPREVLFSDEQALDNHISSLRAR